MPTADPFNAAGRRNGLPFTLLAASDSAINAVDGSNFNGAPGQRKIRVKEFSFDDILPYIWNLYSVTFPTVTDGGTTTTFASDGIYKMGDITDLLPGNLDALTPKERVVFDPGLILSPLGNSGDVAAAVTAGSNDNTARFEVHHICFATDTNKEYLMHSSGLYADDAVTLEVEIPFDNLTFDFYTYS